jgi:cysteine desulfurase
LNEIPGITFNGDAEGESLYTVLNVSFPSNDINEMLLYRLDIDGIAASGGSACSSGSDKGSHVLNELGIEPSRANVRFSFGKYNTREEIDYTVNVLSNIYNKTLVSA